MSHNIDDLEILVAERDLIAVVDRCELLSADALTLHHRFHCGFVRCADVDMFHIFFICELIGLSSVVSVAVGQ